LAQGLSSGKSPRPTLSDLSASAANMPNRDPLVGIFDPKASKPKLGPDGKKAGNRTIFPHIQDEGGSDHQMAYNHDNDRAIKMFEENLEDLFEEHGLKHDGISPCADGLAALYENKAALEKDASFYDKAVEYLNFANSSRAEIWGERPAQARKEYQTNLLTIERIKRKKTRRLAKASTQPALAGQPHVPQDSGHHNALVESGSNALRAAQRSVQRVWEVRMNLGEYYAQLQFVFDDGSVRSFDRLGEPNFRLDPAPKDPFAPETKKKMEDDNLEVFGWEPFTLQEDEWLVGMITMERDGLMNACAFHTNLGRRSHWFEFDCTEPRGHTKAMFVEQGWHITGVKEDPNMDPGILSVPVQILQGHL